MSSSLTGLAAWMASSEAEMAAGHQRQLELWLPKFRPPHGPCGLLLEEQLQW